MKRKSVSISDISLHRPDLAERVAGTIRQLIFEQKLKPGDHVREVQLSQQLNISRTPLREALRYLEHEGLVVRHPFRGVFIASMTEEEMQKVFRIREVLESMAIVDARNHMRAADWSALRNFINAMKAAAQRRDLSEFNHNDMAFHQYIWDISGDEVLERVLAYLLRQNFVVYNIQTLALLKPQELRRLAATHEDMLDMLKKNGKDPFPQVHEIQNRWLSEMRSKLFRKKGGRRR